MVVITAKVKPSYEFKTETSAVDIRVECSLEIRGRKGEFQKGRGTGEGVGRYGPKLVCRPEGRSP